MGTHAHLIFLSSSKISWRKSKSNVTEEELIQGKERGESATILLNKIKKGEVEMLENPPKNNREAKIARYQLGKTTLEI